MSKNTATTFLVDNLSWQVNSTPILSSLSFEVKKGEFVGIIGPNGAGKSSLLRCLYRKIIPDRGTIQFNSHPINQYSRRELAQNIAVVLQEPPHQFDLNVKDVIGIGLTPIKSFFSFENESDNKAIEEAAIHVDIESKLNRSFNSLSGGEKQRVMIARAIVQKPVILLMDEPTNHLDIHHQIEVLTLAKQLDITVVVSIHDLNLAAGYCDRLILLNQGKLISQGSVESVLTETHLSQVFNVTAQKRQHPFHKGTELSFSFGTSS